MTSKFLAKLTKPDLPRRLWKKLTSLFYYEQWIVLLATRASRANPAWQDFTPLQPPPRTDWADPFLWEEAGRRYLFIEELPHATGRGHIACLELDHRANILSHRVVLERPYHLSYPFLFKYNGQLYMLPETKSNHAIELYRCTHFPDQWVFEKNLMPNVDAVDATLVEHEERWWLFVNIQAAGGSSWDTLHLFSAESPLSDTWTPHPNNPIVKDVNTARPAGYILSQNGQLVRPSQDCSIRYGYALNFNRITTLTASDYAETCEVTLKPPATGNILGTHTWNEIAGLQAIDALLRQRKF
jgi:hypothetical protein